MSNIGNWSPVADQNNDPPPNGAPENMPRNTVNNTMREMMGAMARSFRDQTGELVSGGSGQSYTLSSAGAAAGTPYTNYDQLSFVCFEAHVDCLSSPTLSVDNLSAQPLVFDGQSSPEAGDIKAGTIIVAQYNPGNGRFEMLNARQRGFDAGTRLMFQQTNVPQRWQKITTYDDFGIRVVSGAASAYTTGPGWSSVFREWTLAEANLPLVNIANNLTYTGSVSVTAERNYVYDVSTSKAGVQNNGSNRVVNVNTDKDTPTSTGTTSGPVDGTITLNGAGSPLDFRLNQVDVVIGQAL